MISRITHHNSFEFSLAAIYRKGLLLALSSLAAVLLLPGRSTAQQATLTDDAQTSAAAPNQNFGTNVSVRVSGANIRGFFKFKLTPNLPLGTTGSRIGKATLKLFVGGVTTPGTIDVFRVTGAWNEATVTGNTAPPLGALESAISVDATKTNQWVTLDVTQLTKDWLDGVLPNEGIALVANGGVGNVILNSKENQTTSHESGVEIVLNHAATADRAAEADRATDADNAATAGTANSLSGSAVVPGSQVSGDIPGRASSITGTVAGSQVSGPVTEATHAINADNAANATNAVNAATANALAGSATVNGNQVSGDLTNATIAGSRVNGTVAVATNATTADAARGVVRAASDADIVSPIAGQLYFNTTMNVFKQYDSTVWKTIDAALAAQLSSAGTLNAPNNPVDWTQLKNVPANAASGYTAGGGININGSNVISTTGVLSVGATAPLAISGGQNPTLSLAGVIPVANGGTGLNASGASGSFLRSDGGTWTSAVLRAADVPAGSANYIQNSTTQQAGASLNISGSGTFGSGLMGNVVNTATQYNIAGQRVLSTPGMGTDIYVGINAGNANASVSANNSFFGFNAGPSNTTGNGNSFFGTAVGFSNTTGFSNSFYGAGAGNTNTSGAANSFFGNGAGAHTTEANNNSFFGANAGFNNTTGFENSSFGIAGFNNTTGSRNTFVGSFAGSSNTAENNNTFIGADSNGAPGISNATAVGSHAQVTQSNSLVLGSISGVNNTGVDTNVGIGTTAPTQRLEVKGNVKISGAGNGLIFPDGTTQFSASSGVASDLACAGCVSESELSFDPATQAELDAHKISGDHDGRYSLLGHIHNVSEISNAATLGANNFAGNQSVAGNVSATGLLSGDTGSFHTRLVVGGNREAGNTVDGNTVVATNGVNRFAEIGTNIGFDSFGTAVGIRLRASDTGQANAYGLILGDGDGHFGSFIIRQDDMSVPGGGFARNRFIITRSGDVIVNSGRLGVGTESPSARLDVVGDARASGNVTAASFTGDGSGLTNVSASSSTSLSCAGCVSESELDFNPATQAELDAHKSSADHDERYVLKTGGTMTGALNLPANGLNVGGSQLVLVGGNVGIGTVSPGAPLEVDGITRLRNLIATPQDAGLEGGEVSLQGAPTFHSWQMDNYGGNFRLHSQGVARLEVTNAGNVGIGTDAPTNKLEVVGNVRVNGNFVATGSKSAVVTLPDNREVLLYAVESPGNWFEDFGHTILSNGVAHVEIDPTFAQTINTEMTYHVFLTPNGDCKGLYVAKKTATGFEVRELGGGQTNVTFDYRIVARRKGYENVTSRTR